MRRRSILLAGVTVVILAILAPSTRAQSESALVARGQRLFTEQGCHGCHTVGKMGTPIAADLAHVGARYTRPQLESWLRDPAAQRPTAHMPRIQLSGAEVKALAAYLASLR
jgi:mono/diheme cytochrome c family protein